MIRGLRHPGEGGGEGEGGEGAGKGKTQTTVQVREMTEEEFLAKNPKFKERLDTGDAAVQATEKAKKDKLTADGDLQKLLDTEADEHGKTKTKAQTLADENKALKRALEIRDFLDTAKDIKFPLPAIKKFAMALDVDGKKSIEDLVKAAIAEMESLGLAPGATKTDDLGGGGSGSAGGSGQGAEGDKQVAELIELGAKAKKTGRPQDSRAYDTMKSKLRSGGVKLPADLAQRINARAEKAA